MGRLSALMLHSTPYNSQARGVIERFHKTVWVTGALTFSSYIGAGMDRQARLENFKITRAAIRHGGAMRLPSFDLFLRWCGEQIANYNARPHRSLGDRSPDQVWAEFTAQGWQPERMDDDGLAALFRPRLVRTIARGEVELFGNRYFSKELEEFHGLKAHVAYDIHDADRVWIHTPEGRLICEAVCNGNRRAYMPRAVVEQARERRGAGRAKRLEAKAEEIRLEMQGTAALPALAMRDRTLPRTARRNGTGGQRSLMFGAHVARRARLVRQRHGGTVRCTTALRTVLDGQTRTTWRAAQSGLQTHRPYRYQSGSLGAFWVLRGR
jgi:putative transposase